MRPPLILASSSRYRREMLSRLGIPFECLSPDIDESALAGESPLALARRLSLEKARTIARQRPEALVIGSDQTASLDGITVIGKPGTHERAVRQLREASGRTLVFHTGLALVGPSPVAEHVEVVDTRVRFRALRDADIESYLSREPAYDCAGSAKSEGLGIALLEAQEGPDPTALVGLPLIALCSALARAGFPVL